MEVNEIDLDMQARFLGFDGQPGYSETVDLSDSRLRRIVRLRLLTSPGFPFYDVSYCWGELADGSPVRVTLPQHQFPRRGLSRSIVSMAQRSGVHAKRLGMLDNLSLST